MADYYLDKELKNHLEPGFAKLGAPQRQRSLLSFVCTLNQEYWVTKEGAKLEPKNMTYTHIVNVMRILNSPEFLKKHAEASALFYALDPGPSGDAAQDYFDMEFNQALDRMEMDTAEYFEEVVKPSRLWRALEAGKQKRLGKSDPNFPWIVNTKEGLK
jgi:hypothetical protein